MAALATFVFAGPAEAVLIPSMANIYGAGKAVPPNPGGGSGGVLPTEASFAAGPGQDLTFSSVTGAVRFAPALPFNGPDGGVLPLGFDTDISSFEGISGIVHDMRVSFLVGVFLDNNVPVDPAPPTLNFSAPIAGIGDDFLFLFPVIGQTFFIGDGLTGHGTGAQQRFRAPDTATRLFLGFADGFDIMGPPGFYEDNEGFLEATFSISATPEPSTWALIVVGGAGLALAQARRGRPSQSSSRPVPFS